MPTYCLDEDEHRSLIDRGTPYSLAKICWSFVCLLVQEDMLDGEDASDMEDFSEDRLLVLLFSSSGMELHKV